MKRLTIIVSIVFLTSLLSNAQWSQYYDDVYLTDPDDQVGIGLTSPSYKLHVDESNSNWAAKFNNSGSSRVYFAKGNGYGMYLNPGSNGNDDNKYALRIDSKNRSSALFVSSLNGMVGLGTPDPESVLHLDGDDGITIERTDFSQVKVQMKISSYTGPHGLRFIITPDGNWGNFKDVLHLASTGNVGIGTTNPTSKLTVNGEILCEKVRVVADIPYADYVFDSSYKPKSIEEVEEYINTYKHLPDVPSEQEVNSSEGLDIVEMNVILLKKIEEQTLYIIELNKRIKQLEKGIVSVNQ